MNTPFVLLISLHADPFSASGVGGGGGTHAYLRELIREFAMAGRECALLTRRVDRTTQANMVLNRHVRLCRIDIGPEGDLDKRRLNSLHFESLRSAKLVIDSLPRKPDLLHSVYWNSGRLALDLSKQLSVPYVHTVISNGVRRRLEGALDQPPEREEIERKVFLGASSIFSVSSEERADLEKHYGVPGERIRVIGRLVDRAFLEPAHDELGQPRPLNLTLSRGVS